MAQNIQKYIQFKNGHKMPIVGFGTWQATDQEMEAALEVALEVGYRHIDTALFYGNESAIGNVLKRWFNAGKLKREDVFVVTKLPPAGNRRESVRKYLKRSLTDLQLSYVDLYLIHHSTGIKEVEGNLLPMNEDGTIIMDFETDIISLWKGMEDQVDAGRAKSIGLSNFNARQIKEIVQSARIPPANLQVELHLYLQQKELVAFCKALDVTVCGFAPLGSPGYQNFFENIGRDVSQYNILSPLKDPVVLKLAKKYKRTPGQILIRHIIQRGVAVIPKSSNPARIKENFEVFDFELSYENVQELNSLDKGSSGRLFGGIIIPGSEKHPEYPYSDPY